MPHFNIPETVVIDKAQFDKLIELLTPGYELAKLYQKQMQAQIAPPSEEPLQEVLPPDPTVE